MDKEIVSFGVHAERNSRVLIKQIGLIAHYKFVRIAVTKTIHSYAEDEN